MASSAARSLELLNGGDEKGETGSKWWPVPGCGGGVRGSGGESTGNTDAVDASARRGVTRTLCLEERRGVGDRIGRLAVPSTRIGIIGVETFDVSVKSTSTGVPDLERGGRGSSSSENAVVGSWSNVMRLVHFLVKSRLMSCTRGKRLNESGILTDNAVFAARRTVDEKDAREVLAGVGRATKILPGTFFANVDCPRTWTLMYPNATTTRR